MKLLRHVTALACFFSLALSTSIAHAVPISLEFTFSSVDLKFNGVLQPTGAFSMSIQTDTSNPNLGVSFFDFLNAYSADVFITAPALGLNNSRVTNSTQLYFGNSVVGFRADDDLFTKVLTAFLGPQLVFGNPFDLSTIVVPQGPIALGATEFRAFGQAITFDNGSFFDPGQFEIFSAQNTVRVVALTNSVPEPASLTLFGIALAGLGFSRRKRAVS